MSVRIAVEQDFLKRLVQESKSAGQVSTRWTGALNFDSLVIVIKVLSTSLRREALRDGTSIQRDMANTKKSNTNLPVPPWPMLD